MAKGEGMKLKASLKAKSFDNFKTSSREIKKSLNSIWDNASKSWMLKLKRFSDDAIEAKQEGLKGKTDKNGKQKTVNTERPLNKLVNSKSFQIFLSGAAAHANTVLREDAFHAHSLSHSYEVTRVRNGEKVKESIKTFTPEASKAPVLPTISKGAQILIEQVVCAYAQEAAMNAINVKEALQSAAEDDNKKSVLKRLNGDMMRIGFNEVDQRIFKSMAPLDRVYVLPKLKIETKVHVDEKTEAKTKEMIELSDEEFVPDTEEPIEDEPSEEMEEEVVEEESPPDEEETEDDEDDE